MHTRLSPIAVVIALLVVAPAFAQDSELEVIKVSATRTPYPEARAPYASEVHTRGMIEKSGAQSLYDYLSQNGSITVAPSYGNRFTPLIDMRGYGTETGNQNVVISLDGRRLNNIDLMPQLIGAIPLSSIDRIEITKGSGSVMHGDGAMAGSIQIYTRPYNGASASGHVGSHGILSGSLAAGLQGESYGLSVSADHSKHGGFSEADTTGHKDASELRNESAKLSLRPLTPLWLHLEATSARVDTRYVSPLTLAQYQANPAQNGGSVYTHQLFAADQWRVGADLALGDSMKLTASQSREDKHSEFVAPFSFKADYDSVVSDVALIYAGESLDVTAGAHAFDGKRKGTADFTSKDSASLFVQGAYRLGSTTLSAGVRRENVRYEYAPAAGAGRSRDNRLNAWDLGFNQRLDDRYSLFANLNKAYQAPDIDRFFLFGGAFNSFIEPATAKTLTVGVNRIAPGNRSKLAAFRTRLENEIYFEPFSFANTNIDKSHKYGFEAQQFWQATREFGLTANYGYTRAIIDDEDLGAGAYNGKDLPGVSRHTLSLSGTYVFNAKSDLTVSHNWRSGTYAIGDFANDRAQRQAAYASTNLNYRYRLGAFEVFAAVQNLFARKNGLWTADDSIYVTNFARSALIGVKGKF